MWACFYSSRTTYYIRIFSTHNTLLTSSRGENRRTRRKPSKHRREPTTNSTHISPELENRTRTTAVRSNALTHTLPILLTWEIIHRHSLLSFYGTQKRTDNLAIKPTINHKAYHKVDNSADLNRKAGLIIVV
jgi:hypothetical protein